MKKKKYLVVFACAAVLGVATMGGGFASYSFTEADASLSTATAIEEYYALGTAFTVPDGAIKVGDKEYSATEISVVFPDGRTYSNRSFVLENTGKYILQYAVQVDGKTVKEEQSFVVRESLYGVTSSNSTVKYAPLTKVTQSTKTGLQVTLSEGDSLTFNEPIDLNEIGDSEIVKLYPHSFSKIDGDGTQIQSGSITVRLTDCYDENNYVDLMVANCSTGATNPLKAYMPYYRAGAFGLTALGLEHNETKTVDGITQKEILLEGKRYISRYDSKYGTLGEKPADDRGYAFFYDVETTRVTVDDGEWNLVNILNNDDIYDEPFQGFTTGEVYLSVFASEYESEEVYLEIETLGGYAGAALENVEITDSKAPVIEVQTKRAENITIAKGEPFEIFAATATDVNLVGEVKRTVYYNYGTPLESQVGYVGNSFTPNKTGWYSIVYTASDSTGRTAREIVDLWCVETDSGKAIDLTVEALKTCEAGKTTVLPEHTMVGLNGETCVEITATSKGESFRIDETTRAFLPRELGDYEICYRYYDDVYEYEYAYTLSCVASDGVIAKNGFYLPEYFLKGASYSLDEIQAYTYTTGTREEEKTAFYVSEDGKEYVEIDPFAYEVGAERSVQCKVCYDGKTLLESEPIPVVDVGNNGALKIENYFAGEFVSNKKESEISYVAKERTGNATLKFVNPLFLTGFSFAFSIEEQYSAFENLEISLVDYYDRDNAFTVRYQKRASGYVLSVGDERHVLYQNFTGVKHSISYASSTNTFSIENSGKGRSVANGVSFTSARVLLQVRVQGLNGQGGVNVSSLCGQAFSRDVTEDLENPLVSYVSGAGRYAKGSVVTVSAIDTLDVLNTVLLKNVKVFVTDENSGYLTSSDGVLLNGTCLANRSYQLQLDEYGEYTVFYTVVDGNGRQTTISYKITIADNESPVLKLSKGYTEKTVVTAKVGDTVKLVGYTVSDAVDSAENLTVFAVVIDPTNSTSVVKNNRFKAKVKGDHTVCYYAYDSSGNYVSTYYTVRVK